MPKPIFISFQFLRCYSNFTLYLPSCQSANIIPPHLKCSYSIYISTFHIIDNLTLIPRHPPISWSPLCGIHKTSLLTTSLLQTSLPLYQGLSHCISLPPPLTHQPQCHFATPSSISTQQTRIPLCHYPSGTVSPWRWRHCGCSKQCSVPTKLQHGFSIQKNLDGSRPQYWKDSTIWMLTTLYLKQP